MFTAMEFVHPYVKLGNMKEHGKECAPSCEFIKKIMRKRVWNFLDIGDSTAIDCKLNIFQVATYLAVQRYVCLILLKFL